MDAPSLSEGETYMELVYQESEATEEIALAGMVTAEGEGAVVVAFSPDLGLVGFGQDHTDLQVLFSGVDITPGYTVGFSVDHDMGSLLVQDSEGNADEVVPGFIPVNESLFPAIGGIPGAELGDSLTVSVNAARGAYVLLPPEQSHDWCGNAL